MFGIIVLFILGVVIGGTLDNNKESEETIPATTEVVDETITENTGAYYVEKTSNVFVIVAKFLDKSVYFAVVFCFDVIAKIFEFIFGI